MVQTALPANPDADTELEELRHEAARHYGMTTQDLRDLTGGYSLAERNVLSEKLGYMHILSWKEIYKEAQERAFYMKGWKWYSAQELEDFKTQFRLEG
jgi:hypothetical protein